MKKVVMMVALIAMAVSFTGVAKAALNWSYSDDLRNWDASVEAGWFLYLYEDVNGDSTLSAVTFYAADGTTTGAGNSSDDVLLTAYVATILSGKSGWNWGESLDPWSAIAGDDVYSVLYNGSDLAAATQTAIADASSYTLPTDTSIPQDYVNAAMSQGWQNLVAVPEPATFALLGLGVGALIVRRRMKK